MDQNDKGGTTYYQKWYESNRERLSKKRKERYRNDADLRAKAVQRQQKYREKNDRPSTKGQAKFREVNGIKTQVFRISETAEMVGCSIEFIRKYEAEGVIPLPSVKSTQRYYSGAQVKLMKAFYALMHELKYSKDAELKAAALAKHKAEMQENW